LCAEAVCMLFVLPDVGEVPVPGEVSIPEGVPVPEVSSAASTLPVLRQTLRASTPRPG